MEFDWVICSDAGGRSYRGGGDCSTFVVEQNSSSKGSKQNFPRAFHCLERFTWEVPARYGRLITGVR